MHFLNGAYHATPWGTAVNEGVPEWPPSIWRLVRAIIATWKTTRQDLDDSNVWPILEKIIKQEPPKYRLPDASVSHTKHYMPTNDKPDLILNTFVVTGSDDPLHIIWDELELEDREVETMKGILKNMNYFGRAESWCRITISNERVEPNCVPFTQQESVKDDLVSVLVPRKDVKFVDICSQNSNSKRATELRSISVTTEELQKAKYIDPPGGIWVRYTRPENCFEEKRVNRTTTARMSVNLIRYAVVGAVRPHITDTLRVGDLLRSACMSRYNRRTNRTSATFSGKDQEGNALKDHMHAMYLPTYETQKEEIDHITVMSAKGFDKDELDSLLSLKRLYGYNRPSISVLFQACGDITDFSDIPMLDKSKNWISSTPLILTRHTKIRGKGHDRRMVDSPEDQIRNEIRERYGDEYASKLESVKRLEEDKINSTNVRLADFFRWRRHGSVGDGRTHSICLKFKEPVKGPITLGYAAHFGLGMFIPSGES